MSAKKHVSHRLVLYHQNIQCIRNKIEQLEIELISNDVDIACVTETWLRSCELEVFNIDGYTCKSAFCRSSYKNGGVSIFCKSSHNMIVTELAHVVNKSIERDIEIAGIEIQIDDKKFKIINIYRSPSGDINIFFDTLEQLLYDLSRQKSMIILCGDLNIDFLSNCAPKIYLCDLLSMYNIINHIKVPTRVNTNSSTCIDYVCSNLLPTNNNIEFDCKIAFNGLSDHSSQILSLDLPIVSKSRSFIKCRLYSENNFNMFVQYVSRENWLDVYSAKNINDGFDAFVGNLVHYIDVCFPFVSVKSVNNKKSWITSGIKVSAQKLKLLHKIMVSTKRIEDKNTYQSYKKMYEKVLKAAKRLYNDNLYNKASNKSKAAWSIINTDLGKNRSEPNNVQEIIVDNKLIKEPQKIANSMNEHFVNLASKLTHKFGNVDVGNISKNKDYPTIFVEPVTETEIFNIIVDLRRSHSSGMDNISSNIIKSVIHFIVKPITFLINWSISEGIFPEVLKTAKIIPLHKKGDTTSVDNYRPISLLSTISKILEAVIYIRMLNFCIKFNIICDEQHGFRKGRSPQSAILTYLTELYDHLNNNKKCFGVFMDLSKAFDLVNHVLLIEKLKNYGFRGKMGGWLESYLSNRKQFVEFEGAKSCKLDISCGVPQGSVLGPLLFLLFINDLPFIVNKNLLIMFADDTSLLTSDNNVTNLVDITQKQVNEFVKKFNDDHLLINENKTVFIHFTPRSSYYNESYLLKINGKSLHQLKTTKFLGVHLDDSLNWDYHTDILCKKLSPVCFALYRLRNITNREVLLSYYYAQFYSRVVYGIEFWGTSCYFERVFKMQKRAIRNIVGVHSRVSCRMHFKEMKILPLPCIYILTILTITKLNLDNLLRNNYNHNYDTRRQYDLLTPMHSLSLYEKSPKYMGIKLFNKLPNHLKQIHNIHKFKKEIKKLLLENVFYDIQEFLNCDLT